MKKLCLTLIFTLLLPQLVLGDEDTAVDEMFSTPANLTDEQAKEAKDFVHQGIKDRVYKEKCARADGCKDEAEDGLPLELLISKAYSIIGMFMGDGGSPTLNSKPTAEATKAADAKNAGLKPGQDKVKAEQDTQRDYCMMISMAYETVGSLIQESLQKKADGTQVQGDEQLQALVSLHETHKAREKTAKYQSWIYGAVTACYVGVLMSPNSTVDPDANYILKLSGAVTLTGLYVRKANKHKDAANAVGDVIAAMDSAGKGCNPYTKTACFCSEPTSKTVYPTQFEEVCELNKGNFETPIISLGCAKTGENNKIEFDKECKCKQNNSCMKSPLAPFIPNMKNGANLMAEASKTFDLLGNGNFDQGSLDKAALSQASMAAKIKFKRLEKFKAPVLTPEQKKIADSLKEFMPEKVAAIAAVAPPGPHRSGIKDSMPNTNALSKLPKDLKKKLATAISGGYKTGGGSNSSAGAEEPDFVMPTFGASDKKDEGGVEVLNFAEQAVSKADINNSPSTPIFEIISNRYIRSGWKKLDTEGN